MTVDEQQMGERVKPLRMAAYYYSLDTTGTREIDLILSAVACAGKAAHHTEDWRDECRPFEGHIGANPVEWIQNAAKAAAESHAALIEQRDRLRDALTETAKACYVAMSYEGISNAVRPSHQEQISKALLNAGHVLAASKGNSK